MSSQVQKIGSAELQLMQAALRVDAGRDAALALALHLPLDWAKLQRLAKIHGVLPLVYRRLQEAGFASVPVIAQQQMTLWQKAHALRVQRMTDSLITVVHTLQTQRIATLCLKGPLLATLLYGAPAFRDYVDLDILIDPSDYARAEQVLSGMGAVPAYPDRSVSQALERHAGFLYAGCHLEVHWRVTLNGFPHALAIASLFARRQSVRVQGQLLETLSAEDMALHLCLHGLQHCWASLSYLVDFATAVSGIQTERWPALLESAHAQNLTRPLLVTMGLCQAVLGLTLPAVIQYALQRDWRVRWARKYIHANYRHLLLQGPDMLDAPVMDLLLAETRRFQGVAGLIGGMFSPTATDLQWLPLPRWLRGLYPLLRPPRLLLRAIGVLAARGR